MKHLLSQRQCFFAKLYEKNNVGFVGKYIVQYIL